MVILYNKETQMRSEDKDRIIKILNKYNLKIDGISCFPSKGWWIHLKNGKTYIAINADEIINEIESYEGNFTDMEFIREYCDHNSFLYIDQSDHSKGCTCCRCGKYLDNYYIK
jgi:uncharacterized protein YlzI (FlbEa/FlbD family)